MQLGPAICLPVGGVLIRRYPSRSLWLVLFSSATAVQLKWKITSSGWIFLLTFRLPFLLLSLLWFTKEIINDSDSDADAEDGDDDDEHDSRSD